MKRKVLGPCVGHVTATTAKLWVHFPLLAGDAPVEVTFTLHDALEGPARATKTVALTPEHLGCGTVTFDGLAPDTRYHYRLWSAPGEPLELGGLVPADLHFRTMPADARPGRLDFLLLTCHDPPEVDDDGQDGYRVWGALRQVRANNDVRFAILAGDQIYGDRVQEQALRERDPDARLRLYLDTYRRLWRHLHYRRALCSLPAYLMWDDHDVTDGWGSRSDAFEDATTDRISPEWQDLFGTARRCFEELQAARNPPPLAIGPDAGYDFAFKVGRLGFCVADLRSHRNVRRHRVWTETQFAAHRAWVERERDDLDALFFVSPVVFTHGWPQMEREIRAFAPVLTAVTQALNHVPGLRQARWVERLVKRNVEDVAGFRDDLEDAWASDPNAEQAEAALDWLFGLQNPRDGRRPLPVVILSGDIHVAGYSMLYSYRPEHAARPVIEHLCSSPIGSQPMHWLLEAMYQAQIHSVKVGSSGAYWAQVSHHHCHRNVVVCSVRRYGEELQLKAKYYLEGRPQPEVVLSDLNRVSRAERIDWDRDANAGRAGPGEED